MVRVSGRKALEGMRHSLEDAWDGSLGRLGVRNPLPSRRTRGLGSRPGLAVFLVVVSALAVIAAILYRRKRRQVTEHYNMGGAQGAAETETASSLVPAAPPAI